MLIPKNKPIRSERHRRFIASLCCVVSGARDVQAAHIRTGNLCGVGMKPSDEVCIPLSCREHALQHEIGEVNYWKPYGGVERATGLAKALYGVSGNREAAMELIIQWRNG